MDERWAMKSVCSSNLYSWKRKASGGIWRENRFCVQFHSSDFYCKPIGWGSDVRLNSSWDVTPQNIYMGELLARGQSRQILTRMNFLQDVSLRILAWLNSLQDISPHMLACLNSLQNVSPHMLACLNSRRDVSLYMLACLNSLQDVSPYMLACLNSIQDISPYMLACLNSIQDVNPHMLACSNSRQDVSPHMLACLNSLQDVCPHTLVWLTLQKASPQNINWHGRTPYEMPSSFISLVVSWVGWLKKKV